MTAEGTFATPENAISFFVQRMTAGDSAGAFTAFASTSMVDGFDFETWVTRISGMTPQSWLPTTSSYNRTVDVGLREGEIASDLRVLERTFLDPQRDWANLISVQSPDEAATLAGVFDASKLSHLTVAHLDAIGTTHPDMKRSFRQMAAPYGADDYAEYGVLYNTPNGPMSGGFSLLRYGNRWLILNPSSALLGVNGTVKITSEDQYAADMSKVN